MPIIPYLTDSYENMDLMFKNADTFEQRVESKFQKRQEIKCIGYPSVNVFNNRTSLQMIVEENFMF